MRIRHLALEPFDDAHDVRIQAARRHEVDDADAAVVGVEVELVHERPVAVAPLGALHVGGGREQPTAVALVAEERREACARVEAGEAEPVDRAVATYESGRLQVADEAVVLDPHGSEARAAR